MENKKLNVLFISSWYPTKLRPLLGIFVKRHAAAVALKCNVSVIFISAGDNNSIEETLEDGIYTIRGYYKTEKNSSFFGKAIRHLLLWRKVWLFYKKKRGKPDIINANVVFPVGIFATLLKRLYRIPYVITEHWTGYYPENGDYKGFLKTTISKIAVAGASMVITPSHKLCKVMQQLGLRNKYEVILNVVDDTVFTISQKATDATRVFEFIHVSSLLDSAKNINGMIRVFKKFHAVYPQTKFTIIWDEEIMEYLDKITETHSESEGVFLRGRTEGPKLADMMAKADAFLLFSNFENLPCVMLESFCCGVPVIGTRVGDVPEFINNKNGVLVDPKNESQLYEAMEKVYLQKKEFVASEIRNSVVQMVSPLAIAEQFLKVYNTVLKKQ